ncbi:hypothetical protein K491DRAFT_720311 [Lophiostoma macrostomum CBS 122681]|uniref:Uncharacterized protein n=1 Tax=Lophiostoma macrostomum CBS 122681 TaxID=1314788 RepID=A0A6A6SXJ2_9PLEO|nr:hypothetical protein K491DRAFT_720311 [Lophiostoma macrostomum CBS 122681]
MRDSPTAAKELTCGSRRPIAELDSSSTALLGTLPSNEVTPISLELVDKVLVVARSQSEDTRWLDQDLLEWQKAIYTVDDPNATLRPVKNKGREANVYLTYIIDNYSNLPSLMVFIHGHRKHKHGTRDTRTDDHIPNTEEDDIRFEGFDYDNLEAIKTLKLAHVRQKGYANLRCKTSPGCPDEIQPFRPEMERDWRWRPQEAKMAGAWKALFGNTTDVPRIIATPCCAQFAVTKEQVLKRKREGYERYLQWLHETPIDDYTSGRVFEFLWHIFFGRDAV